MKTLIKNVLLNNQKQDILIEDNIFSKISNEINDSVDITIHWRM